MDPCGVMVVDDDLGCRELLGDYLGLVGYQVELAADGREALERLQAANRRPCVILLDLLMPVMGGREFLRQQLRDPKLADIPVVVVSAAVREVRHEAAAGNIQEYLNKPLRLKDLDEVMSRHCPEPFLARSSRRPNRSTAAPMAQ
jgi:CheY-like chemotaxis protein